jgi:hypothetical protein
LPRLLLLAFCPAAFFPSLPARQIEVNHCPSWLITAIYILYGARAPINNPTPNAKGTRMLWPSRRREGGLWASSFIFLAGPGQESPVCVPDLPSRLKRREREK